MKSNRGPLGPHETRTILQQQIEGTLPIGAAFRQLGGRPAQAASQHRPMQIKPAECSPLIGHPRSNRPV